MTFRVTLRRSPPERERSMYASRSSINDFIIKWSDPSKGRERGETQQFWEDLLEDVLGLKRPRDYIKPDYPVPGTEPNTQEKIGREIDVYIPDKGIVIEQKSRGVSLDSKSQRSKHAGLETPYQQAFWYRNNLHADANIRWIIVCNFDEIRIHDLNRDTPETDYETVYLKDLVHEANRLGFLVDTTNSRIERERRVSIKAGEKVVELYRLLAGRYKNVDENPEAVEHSLNVLIVRLVFLLFAEDSGLIPKDALYNYLEPLPTNQVRRALIDLFDWLDTPPDERDPEEDSPITLFPYIDGGLFDRNLNVRPPSFDKAARDMLVDEASRGFDWSDVSPTIFGAMFESTLNPKTRHSGGMHYTSIENIHKVIDPLFLDGLKDELDSILTMEEGVRRGPDGLKKRQRALRAFQDKLASIKILDPACGSGNFLTESYLSLRRLENRVIAELNQDQFAIEFDDRATGIIKVSIDQFYGIEINDFAVSVARTALWIAERQMMEETSDILQFEDFIFFPLSNSKNIRCANALTTDWADVLPADDCDYVIGNPPFVFERKTGQTDEMRLVWGDGFDANMDYVTGWFKKSADYLDGTGSAFAFIATNSITQGAPVRALFEPLFDAGWRISFAWKTFPWKNEAREQAHVHVVVIGMDQKAHSEATLFGIDKVTVCENINPYLSPAPTFFVNNRNTPISPELPDTNYGTKPADHGYLQIKTVSEYERFMADPVARQFVRRCLGADELIHNIKRWCIWMKDADPAVIPRSTLLRSRIDACREWRLKRSKKGDAYKLADTPWLWRANRNLPEGPYLCIPCHFSGLRDYFTVDYVTDGAIATNACFTADDPDGLAFAILTSSAFMTWQNTIGGRLKSDCRFEKTVVWDTFPLPALDAKMREEICHAGRGVLEARTAYPDKSLEELYVKDSLIYYPKLKKAHEVLDATVLTAFGLGADATEGDIIARLVECYAELEGE